MGGTWGTWGNAAFLPLGCGSADLLFGFGVQDFKTGVSVIVFPYVIYLQTLCWMFRDRLQTL